MSYRILQADCIAFLDSLPADSVDLCLFSPPYTGARLYLEDGNDLGIVRKAKEWTAWMVGVFAACQRVCTGLIACVCEGQTKSYRWDAAPALLMADLHRAGFNLRRPCIFHRVGIPGSGGPDYLRGDTEFIVCTSRPGKLPWSDNTACGHPPRWAPGGEMSHRLTNGQRVNQWGMNVKDDGSLTATDHDRTSRKRRPRKPSHQTIVNGDGEPDDSGDMDLFGNNVEGAAPLASKNAPGGFPGGVPTGEKAIAAIASPPVRTDQPVGTRSTGDKTKNPAKENYRAKKLRGPNGKTKKPCGVEHGADGGVVASEGYDPPAIANPGNVIHCTVGGGQMGGDAFASQNEAPFPEKLAEFFVLSFCPPGGTVCDCFSGSGTVAAVSVRHQRNFVGCDLRQSMVELGRKRVAAETPNLFV